MKQDATTATRRKPQLASPETIEAAIRERIEERPVGTLWTHEELMKKLSNGL